MEKKIASRPSNDDATKHDYLVQCEGYSHKENTWVTFENVDVNARGLLEEYYAKNAIMEKDKSFGKEMIRQADAKGARKNKTCKCRKA